MGQGVKTHRLAPMQLKPGTEVVLPSGNRIRLRERIGAEWVCDCLPGAAASGEVWYTIRFL